jgi:hypothetical protein
MKELHSRATDIKTPKFSAGNGILTANVFFAYFLKISIGQTTAMVRITHVACDRKKVLETIEVAHLRD